MRLQRATKKNPRQLPAGGSPSVSSLSGSEVTLSANVQEHSALVPELVHGRARLGSRGRESRNARHLLVEEDRADFSRERQVLEGSQRGTHPTRGEVEAGVAGEPCALADGVVGPPAPLGRSGVQNGTA